ncbi:pyruvate decarboxylase [Malassezia caprae]|uniref:Pyruvate decarboxylase n=1 Tax=Malassezia caprae TaxID=1381934 RepID=A0AAF0IVW2_9BASI|nr:pyruvate decarboxylase [Malassezia caprae]
MLLGDFICQRLIQLGTTHAFGLPGDYNMQLLDHIEDNKDIEWVGCANELNASYAADGYARATGRPAALVTTFGVGELSALNGIAGSYAEQLPVIHIVGMPQSQQQASHLWMHHTLGSHLFDAYVKMSEHVSCDTAILGWTKRDLQNAAPTIDRVLTSMVTMRHPVYLGIPVDLFDMDVPTDELERPIEPVREAHDPEALDYVVKVAVRHMEASKRPLVIVDGCVMRFGAVNVVYDFLKRTGLPVVVAPMGKSFFPEDDEQFLGVYVGTKSKPGVREVANSADHVLLLGSFMSDMNTGGFSYSTPTCHTMNVHHDSTDIGYSHYTQLGFFEVLPALADALESQRDARLEHARAMAKIAHQPPAPADSFPTILTHNYIWQRLGEFLRPGDHLVAEMGSSCFGAVDTALPKDVHYHQQMLYGSIGWSVGAMLGVAVGARALSQGRVILFVGDGSLLLTMQEISTAIKLGLTPIIFVINNDGYEIERVIHGPARSYNNIAPIDHSLLLDVMGSTRARRSVMNPHETGQVAKDRDESHAHEAVPSRKRYRAVYTRDEFDALLDDREFADSNEIQLVELFCLRGDAPELLARTVHPTPDK